MPFSVNVNLEARNCPRGTPCLTQTRSQTITVNGWNQAFLTARENDIAQQIVAAHNAERSRRGLPGLTWDATLASSARTYALTGNTVHDWGWIEANPAQGRAENIFQHNPWVADTLNVQVSGRQVNLAAGHGSATQAHWWWMHSDGHRRSLLNARYDKVGVGVVCNQSTGRFQVVVRFSGTPPQGWDDVPPAPAPDATPPVNPGPGTTCVKP